MAILLEFHCFNALAIFNQMMQTSMMCYILFRVSDLLAKGQNQNSRGWDKLTAAVCGTAFLLMIGVFVYSLWEEAQAQFILLKSFEFVLGVLIFLKCTQLQHWLSKRDSSSLVSQPQATHNLMHSDFL